MARCSTRAVANGLFLPDPSDAVDPAFAANAHARLQFFYRRSPYWDPQMNLYPVGRITKPVKL